ncbi:MAG: NAD(+)/NADH kinase [Bacilli bacterium]|nr:NAD(+)/NADH kinase [Bacilli bacterium]
MIKNIKLFVNHNNESIKTARLIKDKLIVNGFVEDDNKYDLAIAVGGDGSFLRMVKQNNFNSDIYYVGINSGTLGFMQEVKVEEIDKFIFELKNQMYKVDNVGIQETTIKHNNDTSKFYSLNEIVVRDKNLKVVKLHITDDDYLMENFMGDGIIVCTSVGSTAHNLSYGGSIIYPTFTALQITSMGPINSKVYKSLVNSIIIPDKKEIMITPEDNHKDLMITVDGEHSVYNNVDNITTKIDDKKIKCLRLSHYSFAQKINEKLLSD